MAKKKIKNKRKQVTKPDVITNISNEVLAAAYSVASQSVIPVFLKVCRLCESKDGPFLNIFDAEKVTAKKIEELMPFSVLENDDLPHKICFRCSAKLEELYEFIQRCIKTQESLRNAVGKSGSIITKTKMAKKLWEEKLNKNNMTNDDICDALIKKAMEGIQGIPINDANTPPVEGTNVVPIAESSPIGTKRSTRGKESQTSNMEIKTEPQSDDMDEITLKQVKMSLENDDMKSQKSKGKRSTKTDSENKIKKADPTQVTNEQPPNLDISQSITDDSNEKKTNKRRTNNSMNSFNFNSEQPGTTPVKESDGEKKEEELKPFNIMDHISMIKVNGVGVLFQCKLCNRNFLKKEVVESHNCAKNGIPKTGIPESIPAPEPPKAPTVKYIKIDGDMKKSLTEKVKNAEKIKTEKNTILETITVPDDSNDAPKLKPKPKAGPASKTRQSQTNLDPNAVMPLSTETPNTSILPSVHFASIPNINSRFKLCPGPNNVFTLVEDSNTAPPVEAAPNKTDETKKYNRKRKSNHESQTDNSLNPSDISSPKQDLKETVIQAKSDSPEVIDLEAPSQPYPVGLFQTMAHSVRLYEPSASKTPAAFTTPAMKKQSYTVVQTGNPSKLLISTKAVPVEPEVPKKRQRKTKLEQDNVVSKEPFTVTLEDRNLATEKDSSFFTFINVDPLLQPSYVLPTDNIIQESQISTSSSVLSQSTQNKDRDKDKYCCNMCSETFSREKKLLSHIQSHYKKMDEEDQKRVEKVSKKKGKK